MAEGHLYNIAACHTIWDQPEFEKLLGPEATYFTILRDPSDAFESLYSYMNFQGELRMGLSEFLNR